MIKIGVHGSTGRVGRKLVEYIKDPKNSELELVGEWSRSSKNNIEDLFKNSDVIVDFSLPEALEELIALCVHHKKPLVTGTTGIDDNIKNHLQSAARIIPIFYSPNMSLGANLIGMMASKTISLLPEEYDIEIIDIHHKNKKDAPAGTALQIERMMKEASQRHNIHITSIRTGENAEHQILFSGPDETITISHKVTGKMPFVIGACNAAIWLCKQEPNMYNMHDFLLTM